jgi:hypothetical protein
MTPQGWLPPLPNQRMVGPGFPAERREEMGWRIGKGNPQEIRALAGFMKQKIVSTTFSLQHQSGIAQGLDENGNAKEHQIQ